VSLLPEMGTAEIGLVYGPDLQRRTGGTEAVFLALRHLFADLGYRRVEWRCNPENAVSMRAARRFGFTPEGVLRQHRWIKGANHDTAVHAIIDRDWPAIARRMEAWLDPDNFDESGRQRGRLAAPVQDRP
jgi:RimJ/RimL family protein N-acetyltransferase